MTQTIHQFVPNFASGDAIGTHVRHSQRVLRDAGFRSEIFYDEAQASVKKLGRHWSQFDRARDGEDGRAWILFQLSTGSAMTDAVLELDLPYGVYFHNVTPPSFFERWEPGAAENLRRALHDVRRLAPRSRFALANSRFSEQTLVEVGYSPTEVVPVLFDYAELHDAPNAKVLARLRRDEGTRVLFIGRVAPNKCQHDLIAAVAAYREVFDATARLTLVGGRTSNVYYRSLEVLADELGVADSVELTDSIPDDEKLAYWQAADVYLNLSEHEGFTVPLVEAMHLGVPIVAFASSAVSETLGDAGILLTDKDPVVVAAAIDRVVRDEALRKELVDAGYERARTFAVEATGPVLVDAVKRAVAGG
ncbi:MAG TPA: glycosyltransferase [Acidimicrobiales bacterium]